MAKQSAFIAEAKQGLAAFTLQPLPLDQSLGLIEAKGGSIRLECYTADKFEKIVLCTIEIEASSLVEASVLAWPKVEYDLPILWCNLTRVPQVMNVAVFDFLPVMDPVLQPEQTAASIEGLRTLKANALTLFGDTIIDKAVLLPSRAVYALSPYNAVVNLSEGGLAHLPSVLGSYLSAYHDLWKQAAVVEDSIDRDHRTRRLAAIRSLMKANDPGFPFMVQVFGQDATCRVFDAVF